MPPKAHGRKRKKVDEAVVGLVPGDQPESSSAAQRRALDLEWYIPHLDSHILRSKQAYLGYLDDVPPSREFAWKTTHVPPLPTAWSPDDKGLFFASLSRHSRYRPDLIALDVRKTEGQVVDYLNLLDAARRQVRRSNGGQAGFRDRRKRWRSARTWTDGFAPAAREVNERWVEEEEAWAERVEKKVEEVGMERRGHEREERRKEVIKMAKRDTEGSRVDRKPALLAAQAAEERFELEMEREDWGGSMDRIKLEQLDRLLRPYRTDGARVAKRDDEDTPIHRLDRTTRIVLDHRAIEHIQSIPETERTSHDKIALRILLNRKRIREGKRMKKLVRSGMSEDRIMKQGGPDAFYLSQSGEEVEEGIEEQLGERWWLVHAGRAPDTERIKVKKLDAEAEELDRLEMGLLASQKGLELFNLVNLGKMIDSAQSALSMEALEGIYHELRAFLLEPLILHSIVLAEQAVVHNRPDPDEEFHIDRSCVDTALALRGIDPCKLHARSVSHGSAVSAEADEEEKRYHHDRYMMYQPPQGIAWADMHLVHAHNPLSRAEELSDDDAESSDTDEENDLIEEACDKMDEAFDETNMERLWAGEDVDAPQHKKLKKTDLAKAAYEDYETLLFDTMSARRKRRSIKSRSKRFNTTVLKKQGAKMRTGKMSVMIVDSDDEEVDEYGDGEAEDGQYREDGPQDDDEGDYESEEGGGGEEKDDFEAEQTDEDA